ncbi:response regulator [Novosphingobium aquae]|uniref:Response regulator n=1 Tax=Novosphingobium aquae TaxID=3133435 RepID=A0ABU8S4S4_9SPHN
MKAKLLRALASTRKSSVTIMDGPQNPVAPICGLATAEAEGESRKGGRENRAVLHGDVLIVEDMMIIAMEAEDILRDAGAAECHVASSVATALELLDHKDLSFALLDVNLGIEVSEPVAERLLERSIPFVVASGYGDNNSAYPALSSAPSITKPYTMEQLHTAIASAFAKAGRGD